MSEHSCWTAGTKLAEIELTGVVSCNELLGGAQPSGTVGLSNQRMPHQCPEQNRQPNQTGSQPVRQAWQVPPNGQIRSVVHVEGGQQKNVRKTHAGHVDAKPASPE